MLVFKTLYELLNFRNSITEDVITDLKPLFLHENHDLNFMEHIGGHVHILQTFFDFALIPIYGDRESNLMVDYGCFDIAEKIPGTHLRYYKFCNVTSDTGGAMYYIPDYYANMNPFVELSVKESK
jgi:hypothetical protein